MAMVVQVVLWVLVAAASVSLIVVGILGMLAKG
jgi:hypothetical protein